MVSEESKKWSYLRDASWFCVLINIVSGLALLFVLNRGLQTNSDLKDRIQFLYQHEPLWALGWFTCSIASLATFYFFFCLNRAHQTESKNIYGLLKLTVLLATAGIVLDLSAQVIEMIILPYIAHHITTNIWNEFSSAVEQFLTMDRLAVGLTGYAANGLYTIATLLACWSTRNFYPKIVITAGSLVGITGLALSYFSVINSTSGLFWSNAVLMPCLLLWQGGIAIAAANYSKNA